MIHIFLVIIGFAFIAVGAVSWLQTHVVEKHTETERYYFHDGYGHMTAYEVGPTFFKGYQIVKRPVEKEE